MAEYDSSGYTWEDPSGQAPGQWADTTPTQDWSPGDPGGSMSAGSGDAIFTYVESVTPAMTSDTAIAQYMNVGFPSVNIETGQNMPGAPTVTGPEKEKSASKGILEAIMDADPRVQAAALTVGMGALSGMGAGYFTGKKQDEANKIAQQQVDVNRQLAQSQEALNKSKTSQDLSGFRFNQPRGLIDSAAKPFQPAPQLDVTKRWRMPA